MTEKLLIQKDNLAKLLAKENLTIVHRKVPTAYFDLKNRILCCPILKEDISAELYDLFMGHEVSHALNTPYEGVHSAVTKNKTLRMDCGCIQITPTSITTHFHLSKSSHLPYREKSKNAYFFIIFRYFLLLCPFSLCLFSK